MSYLKAAAIVQRVREVLEQSAGALRTVPSGAYVGNYPDGQSDSARERQALGDARIRSSIAITGIAGASPPSNSNQLIYDGTITVTVERTVTREMQLDGDLYDAVMVAALGDADVIRQALEYGGNLTQTAAAAATDIVGGCARLVSSSIVTSGMVDDGAQLVASTMVFSMKVIARPAVA